MLAALQLRLFGSFEARRGDGAPIAPPGRRAVALLACLAFPETAPRSRRELAGLLWPDRAAEQAAGSLRQELSRLRRAFGPDLLGPEEAMLGGLPVLDPARVDCDLFHFAAAVGTADRLQEAARLYRGPLLADLVLVPDDAFSGWLAAQRGGLEGQAIAAMVRLLRGTEANDAVAERLLSIDPTHEEACRYLIRSHAAAGDPARALAVHAATAAALARRGRRPTIETESLIGAVQAEFAVSGINIFPVIHDAYKLSPAVTDSRPSEWGRMLREAPASAIPVRPSAPRPVIAERPSLAVLPFRDLSRPADADPWTASGLTEETTNALARIPGFFVSARHSVEAMVRDGLDGRGIAAALGVRYLVEASFEREGPRQRSHLRLVDGASGLVLWADSLEGEAAIGMAMRDQLVRAIAGRLQPRLQWAEMERALARPPARPGAWNLVMRAIADFGKVSVDGRPLQTAVDQLHAAVEIDQEDAIAHAVLSLALCWQGLALLFPRGVRLRWQAQRHARRALALAPEDPLVLYCCGEVALYVGGDLDRACAMFEAALQRNPNDAWVLASLANVRRMVGDPPEASLVMLAQAERLSPRDPRSWHWLGCEGWCHWKLGDYARMERAARRSLEMVSRYPWGWVQLAGSLALQDRRDEAAAALQTARDLLPRFTPARFFLLARMVYRHRFTGQTRADYRRFCDALQAVS